MVAIMGEKHVKVGSSSSTIVPHREVDTSCTGCLRSGVASCVWWLWFGVLRLVSCGSGLVFRLITCGEHQKVFYCSMQVGANADEQRILKHIHSCFNKMGVADLTVQIEKDSAS
jgi:hypothetical protein